MLRLLGSKATDVLEYSKQYAVWLLIAAPFMCMSFVLNNVLRAEGKAVLSMVGLVVGAVVNVALDPLLIFSAGLGIRGAAIATCISQLLSFAILMFMFLSGKTIIRFRLRSISKKFDVYSEVITTGFPSFCRQVLASLCTVFLNGAAFDCGVAYYGTEDGGKAAQAALGVVQKVFMLAFSMALGIGQGYQPVLGYNYSAQRYDRVKSAYLFTLTFSTCVMAVFGIICGIFSSTVMDLFSLSAEAKNIGSLALRLQCICMPLLPLNFMASVTYQSLGKKTIASILSVSRQGLFYIPAVLIMPRVMGLLGVQSCQALSDLLAFFFAIPFTIMFFNMIKREKTALSEQLLEKANI
jgi:putative MATE family efflux protein